MEILKWIKQGKSARLTSFTVSLCLGIGHIHRCVQPILYRKFINVVFSRFEAMVNLTTLSKFTNLTRPLDIRIFERRDIKIVQRY